MSESTGCLPVPSRLEEGISELQGLHEVLLSEDLDPHVLADFRDALNRVRNAAWAAQQYVAREETGQDSSTVLSFLVGVDADALVAPKVRHRCPIRHFW